MIVELEWASGAMYAGLINAVQMITLNEVYQMVAVKLCDWENHRTDTSYENTLVVKTFAFQFVNSYFSFFYIAFLKHYSEAPVLNEGTSCPKSYGLGTSTHARCSHPCFIAGLNHTGFLATDPVTGEIALTHDQQRYWNHVEQDEQCGGCIVNSGLLGAATGIPDCMYELRLQLISVFVSAILVSNFMEVILPVIDAKKKLLIEWYFLSAEQKEKLKKGDYEHVELEAKWKEYDEIESFKDYSEMVIQYGFVTLFVVAFPLTPLLAFLNNVLEAHVDAVKLTTVRRPKPKKAENIGIWEYFIAMLSTTSALTNCAIVLFTSDSIFPREQFSQTQKLLYFIIFQNSIMVVKRVVEDVVPDMLPKVEEFNLRFQRVGVAVMTGRVPVPAEKEEDVEELNLDIEENPTMMRRYGSSVGEEQPEYQPRERGMTKNPMATQLSGKSDHQTAADGAFFSPAEKKDAVGGAVDLPRQSDLTTRSFTTSDETLGSRMMQINSAKTATAEI
jgi:hypothetical protein